MRKRIKHISTAVQLQIIREYKEKNLDGSYKWKLEEIADRHEISLSSVNNLAKAAGCQCRPRGGRVQIVPNARIMKILRDASEPFTTLERVGQLNPRVTVVGGKRKEKPLTRQRVSMILKTWRKKLGKQSLRTKSFKPGYIIQWAGTKYVVISYDNSYHGAVIDLTDKSLIDRFCWVFAGRRAVLVEAPEKEFTPVDVLNQYLPAESVAWYLQHNGKRHSTTASAPAGRASNK